MASNSEMVESIKTDTIDSSDEEDYPAEKILNKRHSNGQVEYLVKWKYYPGAGCTWEPAHHLSAYKKHINSYEKQARYENMIKAVGTL